MRSSLAPLAFAASVLALNSPPPVPLDAQIGLLHFPVTCQIYGFLNQTFDTIFSATAPVYYGSGQEIYYTDVVGQIDIPSSITGLAPLVNAKQAQANVTVYLTLTNASPSSLLVFQSTINNITFPSGGDALIRIPQGNGTLPPLGPVTLGTADQAHRIFLGQVQVDVELQDSTGKGVFGPVPVTCGKQNIDYVIGSINVDTSTGPPFAPSNGYVPVFPTTPLEYESGSFRFPYSCDFGALGEQDLDLTIGGTIPTYFAPGEKFSLTNSESFLRVPAQLVSEAKSAFPNVTTFDTTITNFEVLFTNASPTSLNVASTPIDSSIDVTNADTDSSLVIPIPGTGTLTVGPVTAGSAGSIVGVAVGTANATVALKDADSNVLYTFPVSCNVPAPLELIGVPITTQQPGNYSIF